MSAFQRKRRTPEEMIAAYEAQIEAIRQRAAREKAKHDPKLRHLRQALRSLDRALECTDDAATRAALVEVRATLSACMSLSGSTPTTAPERRPHARRTNLDLESLRERLLSHVRERPGQLGERIAAELSTDVGTMRAPMKRLIADGLVRTSGQRRGMRYYPI